MEDWWLRVSHNLAARLDGPLHFRFVLQPMMSLLLAIRDGMKGTRSSYRTSPSSLTKTITSLKRLHALWGSVGRLFLLAFGADVVYQIIAFHTFYPGEALFTAGLLAVIPYLVVRSIMSHIARLFARPRSESHAAHFERL